MSTAITRLYNFANDSAAVTPISSSKVDAELDAIVASLNKKVQIKSTAPADPVDGQTWIDLSVDPPVAKIYDQTNAGWAAITLPAFAAYTAKTAPVGADVMMINDSEASAAAKKLTLANLAKAITVLPDGVANTTDAAPDADKELTNKKYVDGKFNTSTGHDHDGTDSKKISSTGISGLFDDWIDKSSSEAVGANPTAEQASTDGIINVYTSNAASTIAYTDSASNPNTPRGASDAGGGTLQGYVFHVKKGYYWKVVVSSGSVTVGWLPVGS